MDDRFEYSYIDDAAMFRKNREADQYRWFTKTQFKFRTYDDANVTREETYRKGEYREVWLADMGSYTQSGGQMLTRMGGFGQGFRRKRGASEA